MGPASCDRECGPTVFSNLSLTCKRVLPGSGRDKVQKSVTVQSKPTAAGPYRTAPSSSDKFRWRHRYKSAVDDAFPIVLAFSSSRDRSRLRATRAASAPHYSLASSSSGRSGGSAGTHDQPITLYLQHSSPVPIGAAKPQRGHRAAKDLMKL